MVKLAIVQGRLSPPVGGRYQHFPIDGWRDEFATAARLGFDGIEWIVSDFSNPLLDPVALDEMASLVGRHGVAVTSVSLDVLMYHPIFRLPWADVAWLLDRIAAAASRLGVPRVSIPIEENSGVRTTSDAQAARDVLKEAVDVMGDRVPQPCIETDLSPAGAQLLLATPGLERLGLLLDLGNIAAYGFAFGDFIKFSADRVFGLHVKDRRAGLGETCPLGTGVAELVLALSSLSRLPRLSDITLQAYRTPRGFLDDASRALEFVRQQLDATQT